MKTTFTLLIGLFCINSQAQTARPITPATGHYQTLAALSKVPNAARQALDTIRFRMQDASKGSFVSTRLRGVYLPTDVPTLLTLPAPPANSSDQTRAELDYMLGLQAKRTPADVAGYKALAAIYHSPTTSNSYDPDYARNGGFADGGIPRRNVLFFHPEISVCAAPPLRAGDQTGTR